MNTQPTKEQSANLDKIINHIIAKQPNPFLSYTDTEFTLQEFEKICRLLKEHFEAVIIGDNGIIQVHDVIRFQLFIEAGGFSKHFQEDSFRKDKIENHYALEIEQMKLQIESLLDAPLKDKKTLITSQAALVVSILALLATLILYFLRRN